MPKRADLIREGDLGVLRIDNPPVNALSPETIVAIAAAFDAFEADRSLAGLAIECAGRTFVAGGDIASFADPSFSPAPFNALLARIEASARPVAAALFGTVLGGGVELALACHLRIAHPGTRFGMPEIALGLLPGSLGTQRLPRLIGVEAAARMITGGKPIASDEARSLGLVDALADNPGEAAREAVRRAAASGAALRRLSALSPPDTADAEPILADLKADAARQPHLPALAAIAASLDAAAHRPFAEGEAVEASAFRALLASPASRALRHAFFAERAARRIPDLPEGVRAREVRRVGVLGAGATGAGVAIAFADANIPVTLVDAAEAALARGRAAIDAAYAAQVSRGGLGEGEPARRSGLVTGATNISELGDVDLVIEAAFEEMTLDVARKLGEVCRAGAVIATSAATLDADRIAAATGRPQDCLGVFSPSPGARLLEVARGANTAADALQTVVQLAQRIGKTIVVSGGGHGFIAARMAAVYARENDALQLEGATPEQIDGVAESPRWIGMAIGPSGMFDEAGVDVGARAVRDPANRALSRALFEAGRCGRRSGEGYYRYEGRTRLPSEARTALAIELAALHGVSRRESIADREIFERLLYPMINEAAEILAEGVARRPGDIDVVWTAGYGFPAWRGGPAFMADEIGLREVVAGLDRWGAGKNGWRVSPLLRGLAERGERLSDWRRDKA
ncbi:3-hydroxyacyl-CoA dehydrogenase [Roseiarcus fermentans]|uniref:3-hydroxyacyl-CoA dehydrogenase n=1 Tax=Roseiarcus fermentans TaxID=1473586 RepID=A0A366FVC8_9HYPH|nr:3-hydroxyacyl-CoA dehydrogenase NAD-binding domain-containing protein [Roseiarcus fermentans]RBP17649.1 3-hydroxyacyl-CoA dehydrogenase [Roseiarcus fermentans]